MNDYRCRNWADFKKTTDSTVKIVFIYHVSYSSLLVRCHHVVNKGCRLSPSAWLRFLCLRLRRALCFGINCTLCLRHRRALCLAFVPLCSLIPSCVFEKVHPRWCMSEPRASTKVPRSPASQLQFRGCPVNNTSCKAATCCYIRLRTNWPT